MPRILTDWHWMNVWCRLTTRLHLSACNKHRLVLYHVTSDREDRSINLQYERSSTTAQVAQLRTLHLSAGMYRNNNWSHKSIRANVLGFRIVNVWNSLPEDVVNASSVNAFKGLCDRHCVVVCRNISCLMFEEEYQWSQKVVGLQKTEDDDDDDD